MTLDAFTRVEVEVEGSAAATTKEKDCYSPKMETEKECSTPKIFTTPAKVVAVYLSTSYGFDNFCANCERLLMVQDLGATTEFVLRIFCGAEKCHK